MAAKTPAQPLIGIIMGSRSDWPTLQAAAAILDELKIPYEACVVSAHRTPERLYQYAKSAKARGLKAVIAGAGGAAHLPGMTASMNVNPMKDPMVSLPLAALNFVRSPQPNLVARGFATAAVLMVLVLVLFTIARILGGRPAGRLSKRGAKRTMARSRDDLQRFDVGSAPGLAVRGVDRVRQLVPLWALAGSGDRPVGVFVGPTHPVLERL